MQNTAISTKGKRIKFDLSKLLYHKGMKTLFSVAFGFVTALPTVPFGVSPLAVAAISVLPQTMIVPGYLGAFFSYLSNSFYDSAASVSALTAIFLFRLIFKKEGKTAADIFIAPLSTLISLTVTGILCGDISSANMQATFIWLATSAVASATAVPLRFTIEHYGKSVFELKLSELFLIALGIFFILLPLGGIELWDMNLLSITVMVLSLIISAKTETNEALFSVIFFSTLCSIGTLSTLPILILPLCIMASRLALPLGKLPYIACFITLKFATNLIFSPILSLIPQMMETLSTGLVLFFTPVASLNKTRLLKQKKRDNPNAHAAERIKETASLFRFLSNSISDVSEAVSKELSVTPEGCVQHIRDTLCNHCELSRFCCGIKSNEISSSIHAVAEDILEHRDITHDLPRCAHHLDMKNKIEEYTNRKIDTTSSEANDIKVLSTDSYKIVSDMLSEISDELLLESGEEIADSPLVSRVEFASLQFKNEREIHSGDSCECFTKGKYLYLLISDGMGSGKLASIDSKMTCGLMKRFLLSGFSFSTCFKLTNTALKLKTGDESFATADICRINTNDGSLIIGKAGAAASYIISENRIRKLNALTFPIGILNEIQFEEISYKLRKNDYLLMMSDGALNNGDDWLEKHHFHGLEPQKICEKIIRLARETYGSSPGDDISVICAKFK